MHSCLTAVGSTAQTQVRALVALLLPPAHLLHAHLPLVAEGPGPQVPSPAHSQPVSRLFGPHVFRGAAAEVARLGGGQMLTEWGIARPDATRPESWGSLEAAWVLARADLGGLSWCYWDTESLGVLWQEGRPVPGAVHMLSRPFPLATAGRDLVFSFSAGEATFHMAWTRGEERTTTLVYLPHHLYGAGFQAQVVTLV